MAIKCLLFLAAFHFILLPLLCRRLPYSVYFDPSTSTTRDGGSEETEALEQLAILARREAGWQAQYKQNSSQLAVLVLTASRRGVTYLGRSLLALHREVTTTAKRQPLTFVCTGEEGMEKEYSRGFPFLLIQPDFILIT